ncbi:hypothetical protein R3P38DRAFT_2882851 [Favolaschia claudopus]|uniref:DUF6534 domain-containing protein n=1 Tax=Favolaschia claudopus TaxID=2862362 RepID=A0AAW0D2N3_9AGAR
MGEFTQSIGALTLGVVFNTYMMGVLMSQFFTYWTNKNDDSVWIGLLVFFLFAINAVHSGTVVYMLWFYTVDNFTNAAIVTHNIWAPPFTAVVTAILAFIFHTFQSWRIYKFTGSKFLSIALIVGAVAAIATGLAAAIGSWLTRDRRKLAAIQPIVYTNLTLQTIVDVIIAGTITIVLTRSKTSFARTDRVLNRLIQTAVQSGCFTAVFALGTLFSFKFKPASFVLLIFAVPIGRIYTHTLMDHFTRRNQLRDLLSNNGNMISVPNFGRTSDGVHVTVDTIMMDSTSTPRDADTQTSTRKDKDQDYGSDITGNLKGRPDL